MSHLLKAEKTRDKTAAQRQTENHKTFSHSDFNADKHYSLRMEYQWTDIFTNYT